MTSTPVRVDTELFEGAKAKGLTDSRSGIAQLEHWARIGREFERSVNVSVRDVELVLAGHGDYDALAEPEQAVVRAGWDEAIAADIAGLNFEAEFEAAGDTWVVGDAEGYAVVKRATPAAS